MSSLSSRLLLQALVVLPSPGVVEELLATAAASAQLDTPDKTNRAIGLAADVLSLVASGDISLAKVVRCSQFTCTAMHDFLSGLGR